MKKTIGRWSAGLSRVGSGLVGYWAARTTQLALVSMVCVFSPFLAPRPALSQLTDLDITVGPNKGSATKKNPAIFFLYDDKGARFKITVDDLPAPNPYPMPGTQAWDDASAAKAQAIAFAINTQMPGERASARPTLGFVPTKDGKKFDVVFQWEVHVENVTGINLSKQDKKEIKSPLGETDQSRLTNRSTSKVSLPEGSLGGDGTTVATGLDPLGDSSVIQIGLLDPQLNIVGGDHIASMSPKAGMTEDTVLSALDLQLDAMGISATFDLFSHELTLDNPVPEGYFLIWTTTDTGLNLSADFGVVPAPGALLLLGAGLAALAGLTVGATNWKISITDSAVPPVPAVPPTNLSFELQHLADPDGTANLPGQTLTLKSGPIPAGSQGAGTGTVKHNSLTIPRS